MAEQKRYIIFNKPYGVLSSFTDPDGVGRETLADYVPVPDVYAAGRLDYDSEGLMLLTNDGKLSHRLTHPRYRHSKTYLVQVERVPDEAALDQLRHGVVIKGGYKTRPAQVERLREPPNVWPRRKPIRERKNVPTAWLKITITEGKKRQIRRMTAAVGHPTLRLVRVAIGPIELADLPPGAWRELTPDEVRTLREYVTDAARRRNASRARRKRRQQQRGRSG
nr:pseudouridine synthase [Ardenticatena sp.]